jgi:hypothetical protein
VEFVPIRSFTKKPNLFWFYRFLITFAMRIKNTAMQRPSEKRGMGGYLSAIPRAKHKISMSFWYRKSKVNSEKGTLYIYVIVDANKSQEQSCSTHVEVLRQDWDSKNQKVLESDPLHEEKNEELTYIRKLFLKLKEKAEEEQSEITSKSLVESFILFKRSIRVDLSISTQYKRFLGAQKARNDIKESSLNIYEHTFTKLEGFLRSINRPNLEVHNFTIPKADQFKTYLLQTCKLSAEPAVKVLTIVKKFLAFCVSMEVIRHSPLEHYTLQRPKPATPKVLNLDELVALEETVLPKRLRKVADFFLMQC